ncbi:hypothetical protein HDU81_010026 [Chytriomyces hyalinus]|nr:hypothetical protein HDU81_010026 [Chytriomyces hyalinus]
MATSIQTPVLIATFLCAMAFENALKGLILSVHKFTQSKTPVPAIMVVSNTLSLVYGPVYVTTIFSIFLLYKTWVVSQKHRLVAIGAIVLLINRFIWVLADCTWSKSVQTPSGCYYQQDKVAIVGISTGGILVDIFCTSATIASAFKNLDTENSSSKLQRIYRVLIADNVLRTLSILAVNAFTLNYAMYSSLAIEPGTASVMVVIPAVSNFVYTQALNAEFAWIQVRQGILKAPEQERDVKRLSSSRSR